MNYIDEIEKNEEMQLTAGEPVVNIDLQRTLNFFERHHNPDATIENAMPLNEAFDILRERIKHRYEDELMELWDKAQRGETITKIQ